METKYSLFDILLSLSSAADLVTPELNNHHQQVAYLSYRIAEQLRWSENDRQQILLEGLLHDIGAASLHERLSLIENESSLSVESIHSHAWRSARILEKSSELASIAEAVRFHHVPWNYGAGRHFMGHPVPTASQLLYLADRTCVLIKRDTEVLTQMPAILDAVQNEKGSRFLPEAVDALMELGNKEYIWLELTNKAPLDFLHKFTESIPSLCLDDVVEISHLFSQVIDFRSHFTATHSAGVASTAKKLGEIAGLTENECKMLLIAGYLHDLGKLSIPNAILEKPAALNAREYSIIRSHSFYTYQLLKQIHGFETINQWASFHHERINGTGYPFHLKGDAIPFGSRIMAAADLFTAVTEHRPYRKGMEKRQIIQVIQSMVKSGALCPNVVKLLLSHFDLLTEICRTSQKQASESFQQFIKENLEHTIESSAPAADSIPPYSL